MPPENDPAPTSNETKLRRRVEELEKQMADVFKALQKVDDEINDEWGVKIVPEGRSYYGIQF